MEIRGILKNLCRNLHEKENEYVRHQVSEIGNTFIKIYILFFPKQYYPLPDVTYMSDSIGERLKELRKTHNFTQKKVANYLGFKQSQIDAWKTARKP